MIVNNDIDNLIGKVYLYDMVGNKLKELEVNTDKYLIMDLINYNTGLYILKFEDSKGNVLFTNKLIVSHVK